MQQGLNVAHHIDSCESMRTVHHAYDARQQHTCPRKLPGVTPQAMREGMGESSNRKRTHHRAIVGRLHHLAMTSGLLVRQRRKQATKLIPRNLTSQEQSASHAFSLTNRLSRGKKACARAVQTWQERGPRTRSRVIGPRRIWSVIIKTGATFRIHAHITCCTLAKAMQLSEPVFRHDIWMYTVYGLELAREVKACRGHAQRRQSSRPEDPSHEQTKGEPLTHTHKEEIEKIVDMKAYEGPKPCASSPKITVVSQYRSVHPTASGQNSACKHDRVQKKL